MGGIMKNTALVLVLIMCFSTVSIFGQGTENTESSGQKRMPLTWEIVTLVVPGEGLKELNYYLSNPFTLKIIEQNKDERVEVIDGSLITRGQSPAEKKLKFTSTQKGKLHTFHGTPRGREIFEIFFDDGEGKDIMLRFQRNARQNSFNLFSAVIDTKNYILRSGEESPHLVIMADIMDPVATETEVEAIPASVFIDNASRRPTPPSQQMPAGDNPGPQPLRVLPIRYPFGVLQSSPGRSRNIEGPGSVTKAGVVAFILSQNSAARHWNIDLLVDTYFKEAALERVNYDIAIAQMLHATNFLGNEQRMSAHNYAGLSPTLNWKGSFPNMTEGVRAHIQHLKGYSSSAPLSTQTVDPRFNVLSESGFRGTVKTVDQLFAAWATYPTGYRESINEKLNSLYRHSENSALIPGTGPF